MADTIPTTREIAEATGFNQSTISRALTQKGRMSATTRDRILQAARELGWKPNPMANAYMSHLRSTRKVEYQATLAYLVPFRDPAQFTDYQQRTFEGARRRAASLGFVLEPIWFADIKFSFERLTRILKSRGIPGLVLTGRELPLESFQAFDWNSFAAVTWGYSLQMPLHRSAHDGAQGMRLLLASLRERGYRRIALILSEDHDELSGRAMIPTFYYQERHHAKDEWIRSFHFKRLLPDRSIRDQIKGWITEHTPEVIIGETVVWSILEEMQWKVPRDVAYASPFWSAAWPQIAGIDQRPEVIGAHAAELLANQLIHNERGQPDIPKVVLNEGIWVNGDSVPSRARSVGPGSPPL